MRSTVLVSADGAAISPLVCRRVIWATSTALWPDLERVRYYYALHGAPRQPEWRSRGRRGRWLAVIRQLYPRHQQRLATGGRTAARGLPLPLSSTHRCSCGAGILFLGR